MLLPFQFTGPLRVLRLKIPSPFGIVKSQDVAFSLLQVAVTLFVISVDELQIASEDVRGQVQDPVVQSLFRAWRLASDGPTDSKDWRKWRQSIDQRWCRLRGADHQVSSDTPRGL